jgi:hypothetical protein
VTPDDPRGRTTALYGGLILALCAALPFRHVILAGHVLYERDIHAIRWGQLEAFARCIASGSWPLWNPFEGLGQPMLANPGSQVLYPFTWLSLALAPQDYYDVYAFAHVLFAGLGAFVLARRLGASRRGSLLCGALFLLSGPLLSVVNLWQHLAGAAWVPWVLAAGDAAMERPTVTRTLAGGGAVAAQMLTGSLDYVLLGAAAQALLAWRHLGWRGERRLAAGRRLAAIAGAAGVALGLSAAQWVPALALLRGAWRAELGEAGRLLWSLHPALLLQALAPLFPQDLPLAPAVRHAVYDDREPLLSSIYLGAAALPLVIAGLGTRPRRVPALLASLGLAATALALGRHGIAYFWAIETLPALELFRFPGKTLVLAALAWASLAGLGLDEWARLPRPVRALAGAVSLLVATALGVAWAVGTGLASRWLIADPTGRPVEAVLAPVMSPLLPAALLAAGAAAALFIRSRPLGAALSGVALLVVADVALANRDVLPSMPRAFFSPTPGLIAAAKADGVVRLQFFDYLRRRMGRSGPTWKAEDPPSLRALPNAVRSAFQGQEYPLGGARWGVRGGYVSDVAGLESRSRLALSLLVRYHQEDGEQLARLLRLAGITHLAARHRAGLDAFALRAEVDTARLGEAFLFRVPRPLPRAYAVEGVRVASGPAAYSVLQEAAFEPSVEVVLPSGIERPATAAFSAMARVVEERPDRVRVEARLSRPGQLVVLEGFDPGWRAWVDGRATEPQPANTVFLSVPLEAGVRRVEFVYRPRSVPLGLGVSGAVALVTVLLLARARTQAVGRTA